MILVGQFFAIGSPGRNSSLAHTFLRGKGITGSLRWYGKIVTMATVELFNNPAIRKNCTIAQQNESILSSHLGQVFLVTIPINEQANCAIIRQHESIFVSYLAQIFFLTIDINR